MNIFGNVSFWSANSGKCWYSLFHFFMILSHSNTIFDFKIRRYFTWDFCNWEIYLSILTSVKDSSNSFFNKRSLNIWAFSPNHKSAYHQREYLRYLYILGLSHFGGLDGPWKKEIFPNYIKREKCLSSFKNAGKHVFACC